MILGLSGKKQAGKSTVAKHLVEHHGFTEISWAEPLKEIIGKQLLGLTDEQMSDGELKEKKDPLWGETPRRLLQLIGTECFRAIVDPDFWVKIGVRNIHNLQKQGIENFVISDCRFPNEMFAVKELLGGHSVRIVKEGQISNDFHGSEVALDKWNFDFKIVVQPGDISGLKLRTNQLVEFLSR